MQKKLKEIPRFKSEDEERKFWATNDSSKFVDWESAEAVILPKLKPTTRTISLRLSGALFDKIRLAANKRDVPYQSLIKIFLKECIDKDLNAT